MHKERSAKTLYVDIDDEVNALHTQEEARRTKVIFLQNHTTDIHAILSPQNDQTFSGSGVYIVKPANGMEAC
jgi:5-keto 4-deoxyuronate isomerase